MEPRSRRSDEEKTADNFSTRYESRIQKKPSELRDPARKSEAAFTKDDEANVLIDLYLFGKGANINS